MAKNLVRGALLVAFWCLQTAAAAGRVVSENSFSDDSEDASQQSHYIGLQFLPQALGQPDKMGFWYGQWQLDDPTGAARFDAYRFSYESRLPAQSSVNLRATVLDGYSWTTWSGAFSLATEFGTSGRLEGSVEHDLIDSVPAIRQKLTGDTYTLSADFNLAREWTLVGALLLQEISDTNQRKGGVVRLIYSPAAIAGLSLQTKSRYIVSDFDGDGYFSPPELQEHLLLMGYATGFAGDRWSAGGLLGPGWQRFDDGFGDHTDQTVFYGELRLRGWFSDHFGLEGRGFCTNTGGPNNGVPDDDYRYCSALLSLIGAW